MTRKLPSPPSLRQQPRPNLVTALSNPRTFYNILDYIEWRDLHALLNSCSAARSLFRSPDLRDLILSQFVPGYKFCLLYGDQRREHDVYVSIHDLDLFCEYYPLYYSITVC